MCQCDYSCLGYGECCKDYESQCTTKNSCKGRCGESFKRGRLCSCDPDCIKYKQCCPDYKMHCDEDSTLNEATEEPIGGPSTFSEGNNPDEDFFPPIGPTSYPQDDVSDGKYNQNFPNDDSSNPDPNPDPGSDPVLESTSGYESSPPDLLDPVSTEPTSPDVNSGWDFTAETFTGLPQTETTPSDPEPTQASTLAPTETTAPDTDDLDKLSDATVPGTTTPETSTDPNPVSTQFPTTSEPSTDVDPTSDTPDLQTTQDAEMFPDDTFTETPSTDPTATASDDPEATSDPEKEPGPATTPYPTVAEDSTEPTTAPDHTEVDTQTTSSPESSTPQSTSVPDQTTMNPESSSTADSWSDLSASTTQIPSTTEAAQDTTDDLKPEEPTTADPLKTTPGPTGLQFTSKPTDKPDPYEPLPDKPAPMKPTSKPETKPAETTNLDTPRDYQGDDSNDTNLCSGRPVSAVTTLRNGTMVVFRGHFFWFLDRNRVPGPARGITEAWGVPSPIDTAFTRCNCQGKTYIFKGPRYWRFENDALDPGYPKVVETGFDGLRGHITAALSVPQHKRRREAVYFFKRGGTVQKYSYQFGTNPSCGRRLNYAIYTVHNRFVRQAVSRLEPSINIRTSWKGFPTSITAAVSVPNSREPDGYNYYVFSRSKSYRISVDGERPAIAAPQTNTSPQTNDFFRCPKTA